MKILGKKGEKLGFKSGILGSKEKTGSFVSIIAGVLTVLVSLTLLSLALALLYSKSDVSEGLINGLKVGVFCFSMLLGGYVTGRRAKSKGLIHGVILGVVLILCSWLATLLSCDLALFPALFKSFLILLFTALGGVFGVR